MSTSFSKPVFDCLAGRSLFLKISCAPDQIVERKMKRNGAGQRIAPAYLLFQCKKLATKAGIGRDDGSLTLAENIRLSKAHAVLQHEPCNHN